MDLSGHERAESFMGQQIHEIDQYGYIKNKKAKQIGQVFINT